MECLLQDTVKNQKNEAQLQSQVLVSSWVVVFYRGGMRPGAGGRWLELLDLPLPLETTVLVAGRFPEVEPIAPLESLFLSFMTIFAWISSNFAALTFLGQNSVTNLRGNNDELSREVMR